MALCFRRSSQLTASLWKLRFVQVCPSHFHGTHRLSSAQKGGFSSFSMPSRDDAQERRFEYNWIDGAESLEKYRPGGYHPIMVGDVLHDRYQIIDKLGYSGYSTVWLAHDVLTKTFVAVKVGIADSSPDETKVLRALSEKHAPSSLLLGRDALPLPLDEFELCGPNGKHQCYTMTPAQCNLKEASFSRFFPLEVARALSYHLTLAIAYTHSQGYAHGDVHLRNILVKMPSLHSQLSVEQFYETYGEPDTELVTRRDGKPLPPNIPTRVVIPLYLGKKAEEFTLSDTHILLSDFGESFNPTSEPRSGESCHTPLSARPPEAFFEPQAPLSFSADIWSLATSIWEILGMKAIFSSECYSADELASQHIDLLGPVPRTWWEQWNGRSEFFDASGHPVEGRYVWPPIEQAFEEGIQKYRRMRPVGEYEKDEAIAILNLMRRMLSFRPEDRPTAEEILSSEWMVKWCLPDFQRSLHTD